MSAGDWERITTLFDAARLLAPADREAFLSSVCGKDERLRAELESLLAQDAHQDHFLSRAAAPELADWLRRSPAATATVPEFLLDRYRVGERLASGGQALIYLATDEKLSRQVVIKVLRPQGRRSEWLKSRLRQEMEALSRIDHPAVAGILDTGVLADDSPFLVIQYVAGESLRQALRNGPLDPSRTAAIVRQTGSALSAAHALGIAHRDLKPENIMLHRLSDGNESVKLIDFGIAKIERSALEPDTTTVMLNGTVRYMAPEQLQGESTHASDIYSLALVTCEMLCGHPDPRALPASLDRRTRRSLEGALAFQPDHRPPHVGEWAEQFAGTLNMSTRRRWVLGAGAAAAAVAAGSFAAVGWLAATEEPRVIEKNSAFDPLSEGFQIHNDLSGTVADNPEHTSYDGWRVTTNRQGHYYRHLTDRQKRNALSRGWTLSAVMRVEEGGIFTLVDFAGRGPRFDINFLQEGNHELVRLNTQILPSRQGIGVYLPRARPVFRQFELRYDPGLRSAGLWIDGKQAAAGYVGHSQFQDDWGLCFGAIVYASPHGTGTFQSVRFAINP
jgi:serine/threonine protein kinase